MTQQKIAQLNARRRRELQANPVRMFCIEGTPYKLALPHSIKAQRFSNDLVDLFGRKLCVVSEPRGSRAGLLRPIDALPRSWFVDLSQGVEFEEVAA